jgi:hypothetical protein
MCGELTCYVCMQGYGNDNFEVVATLVVFICLMDP